MGADEFRSSAAPGCRGERPPTRSLAPCSQGSSGAFRAASAAACGDRGDAEPTSAGIADGAPKACDSIETRRRFSWVKGSTVTTLTTTALGESSGGGSAAGSGSGRQTAATLAGGGCRGVVAPPCRGVVAPCRGGGVVPRGGGGGVVPAFLGVVADGPDEAPGFLPNR